MDIAFWTLDTCPVVCLVPLSDLAVMVLASGISTWVPLVGRCRPETRLSMQASQDHPAVLRLFEYYADSRSLYLITDLLPGRLGLSSDLSELALSTVF